MNKKAFISFIIIYLFLYVINYLTPLAFGDDYLYSFIWQGNPMFTPLTEDAVRISSWRDLFCSQWSHYFTWSGRTVAHTLAQFFLWIGKDIFNFFNAFVGTLLVMVIYWCINKGKVSLDFEAERLLWIFFVLWSFTPGFSVIYFWLTGACNYLWTNTILLGFLIPYIQKYYSLNKNISCNSSFLCVGMFFWGIIAGWTNENNACWIIVLLFAFVWKLRKDNETTNWMYVGIVGLIIGYSLLFFAPGNMARFRAVHGSADLSHLFMNGQINTLLIVLLCQIFLWYFNLRAFYSLKAEKEYTMSLGKDIFLAKVLCIIAFCMSAIMLLAPEFPARSGFSGTIQLTVAAGILLRVQKQYDIELIKKSAIKFLFIVGIFYFGMTVLVTLPNFYEKSFHMKEILTSVEQVKTEMKEEVLSVKSFRKLSNAESWMSGFHVPSYELPEDENRWENVAFARYYGIKGIRMIRDEKDKVNK